MATTVSISKAHPKLESVFGPITSDEDADIREIFHSCDKALLGLAKKFGNERAGWEGTGLELEMMPHGQVSISSFVETHHDGDNSKCVSFCIELVPGWYSGEKTGERVWEIEAEIYADCQHKEYHGSMDLVHEISGARANTPTDAANSLLLTVEKLTDLAKSTALSEWLTLASDYDK